MHDKLETLYELCETISRELEDVNKKIRSAGGGMSAGDLELVDKLTHAMKSIKTTIAMVEAEEEDGGYSQRNMPMYGGMSYRGMSRSDGYGGMSSAGRMNAKRDSRGRYSRNGYSYAEDINGLLDEMREMMDSLPEEKRREVERFVNKMDRM